MYIYDSDGCYYGHKLTAVSKARTGETRVTILNKPDGVFLIVGWWSCLYPQDAMDLVNNPSMVVCCMGPSSRNFDGIIYY